MSNLECKIARKILFIGLDYTKPKGGIASVLHTYSSFISPFNFISTSASDLSIWKKLNYAFKGYLNLIYTLFNNPNIRIIHIHSASGTSFWRKSICILIARLFRKKTIFHCHGGGFKEFRNRYPKSTDYFINKCDAIIALSDYWKKYFESIYTKPVVVIRNVIQEPIVKNNKKDKLVHFLFLGLVCDNKGIFDLLNVIENHKSELENKFILHIGGNGEIVRLQQTIRDKKISNLVKFEGWVDSSKKIDLLNLCDVFILPSYIEGVPISILEAESYKKPIITTGVGGIPSIVKHETNGYIVNPGNLDEIYKAITDLLNNKEQRETMGTNGYEISKEYLPSIIAKQLYLFYTKLINEKENNSHCS